MGRKKISIQPIAHSSTRRATFDKRRIGLLKKAMELSILCKSAVSLSIYTDEGEVFIYSSEPYENITQKFQDYAGPYRLLTNDHLHDLVPGKSSSNNVGYEIVKQPAVHIKPHIINNHNGSNFNTNASILMPSIKTNNDTYNNTYVSHNTDSKYANTHSNTYNLTTHEPMQKRLKLNQSLPTHSLYQASVQSQYIESSIAAQQFVETQQNEEIGYHTIDMQRMSEDNTISSSDTTFMISNTTSNTESSVSVSATHSRDFKYIGKRRKYSELLTSEDVDFDNDEFHGRRIGPFVQHNYDDDDDLLLEVPEVDFQANMF